jgi:hypothetical protein
MKPYVQLLSIVTKNRPFKDKKENETVDFYNVLLPFATIRVLMHKLFA